MKTNNTMLRTLLESSDFHLYKDSSKNVLLLSQLISDLSWRTHTNIIIVQHYNNQDYPLIYTGEEMLNLDYYEYEGNIDELFVDCQSPVTVTKEYLKSLYTIVGYWKGDIF